MSYLGQPQDVFFDKGKGKGEIVIVNESLTIKFSSDKTPVERRRKPNCEFSEIQKSALELNNEKSISLKTILKQSDAYRFKTEEENDPNVYVQNVMSGDVKSYVSISKPGYSENTAVVIVSFTWSTHGALAKFIYKMSNDSWELECFERDISV